MKIGAWVLSTAWLAAPAWSQAPALAPEPAVAPASFDLRSETVRRIVRDTATSQVVLASVPGPSREREAALELDAPLETKPETLKKKTPTPRPAPSEDSPWLEALFDILFDRDSEEDFGVVHRQRADWLVCKSPDAFRTDKELHESCPGMGRQPTPERLD